MDPKFANEFYRCLVEIDVEGIRKVWEHVQPGMEKTSAADALKCIHIARVEAKHIHKNLKDYSVAFLAERGIQKLDGRWIEGPPVDVVVDAVGIASKSADPAFAKLIVRVQQDALLNGLVKGITEPEMQRPLMRAAREKVRRRAGLIT